MASFSLFILSILFLSLSSLTSSLPSSTILDAAEILSNSGFQTMALNLELASQTLTSKSRSLTIFAPTDFAFEKMGQLPLSLLRYHILPHAFSLQSFISLPFGAKIVTLLPGHSLVVTTSHSNRKLSINNVSVNRSPIFDNGFLVIFETENFFDPYFQIPRKIHNLDSNPACFANRKDKDDTKWFSEAYSFQEACEVLRSRGCAVMASFLDMQFLGLKERPQLTLFAPIDEVMVNHIGNLTNYSSILRHHLVPCKILWSDLVTLEEGTVLRTYQRGFNLNVTISGDMLHLNEVPVIFPELYYSDWLVVHGLREVLSVSHGREKGAEPSVKTHIATEEAKESFSSSFGYNHYGEENPASHYHFSVFH